MINQLTIHCIHCIRPTILNEGNGTSRKVIQSSGLNEKTVTLYLKES